MGDVIIQKQHVDGYENPQIVARFTINAVPALAVLDRCASAGSNDAQKEMWAAVDDGAQPAETKRAKAGAKGDTVAYSRMTERLPRARQRESAMEPYENWG